MEEKTITSELTITRRVRGEVHTSKYSAKVDFCVRTSMRDVSEFISDMEKIWRKAISAAKNPENLYEISMDISESTYSYDDGATPIENWKQHSYNRWYLRNVDDICTEKGEESIYLVPDTRYTSETRDMLIGKNVMHDMGEYMH